MKIFIGIDPGINCIGYAVIILTEKEETFIYKSGSFLLVKNEKKKIKIIFEFFKKTFNELVDKIKGDFFLCVESQFVSKNPQASFVLITVKSIFLLLAELFDFTYSEMAPMKIKKIITGSGSANKQSVQNSVSLLFNINNFSSFDESDAVAISFAAAISSSK